MSHVTAPLTRDELIELDRACEKTKTTREAFVAEAVRAALAKPGKAKKGGK